MSLVGAVENDKVKIMNMVAYVFFHVECDFKQSFIYGRNDKCYFFALLLIVHLGKKQFVRYVFNEMQEAALREHESWDQYVVGEKILWGWLIVQTECKTA